MICTVREFNKVANNLYFTEAHENLTNSRKSLRDVLACNNWDIVKVGKLNTLSMVLR
jgi:hypothetical protein